KQLKTIKKALRVYNAALEAIGDETGWSIDEMLTDMREKAPGDEMSANEELKKALSLLDTLLDERQATILRMRSGLLDDEEPKTLKKIAELLGISREGLRQIEVKALRKLSDALCNARAVSGEKPSRPEAKSPRRAASALPPQSRT